MPEFSVSEDFVVQTPEVRRSVHVIPARKLQDSQIQARCGANSLLIRERRTQSDVIKEIAYVMAKPYEVVTSVFRRAESDDGFPGGQ